MKLPIKNYPGQMYTVRPSKIIAIGLNYKTHIAESDKLNIRGFTAEEPTEPVIFPKTPNAITGCGTPIILPAIAESYGFENVRTDYEGELAVIIGKKCKNITKEKAADYIYGYTAANDVSQRNIQNADKSGWFRGKSFDTFLPLGPQVVLHKDIENVQNLRLVTRLNGITVQDSNTNVMIFPINELVAFLSKNFTLEAGDIILTGTPSGVGELHVGDSIEIEIEQIGILRNTVEKEA
jgi:2-keto-4-pentenoate hydratase/2-oxohepta-3-ene-1,7-dioic acid hydratase in catechol pathway